VGQRAGRGGGLGLRRIGGAATEGNSVVPRLALYSGLRQSGSGFGAVFCGTAEAVPLTKKQLEDRDSSAGGEEGCGAGEGGWGGLG
jgi:hypothetical protein